MDKVTTLICAHVPDLKYKNFLIRAIDSLASQSRKPDEVVLVLDECRGISDLQAEPLVRCFPEYTLVVRKKKEGLAFAKNEGLAHCTGDWITFLDVDDMWMNCKLEIQLEKAKLTGADFVFTQAWDMFRENEWKPNCFRVGQYETHEEIRQALYKENVLCHGSAMIKREALETLGGYRNKKGYEDYDLWARAMNTNRYKFYNVPERLYVYSMGTSVER